MLRQKVYRILASYSSATDNNAEQKSLLGIILIVNSQLVNCQLESHLRCFLCAFGSSKELLLLEIKYLGNEV